MEVLGAARREETGLLMLSLIQGVPEGLGTIFDGVDGISSSVMDAEELVRRYAAGERDFAGVDLSRAYLTIDPNGEYGEPLGHDLGGINLSGASLYRARLTACNLSNANLSGADLRADLTLVNLTGANLTGADLSDAYLNEAILVGANLTRAKLLNTEMSGADLTDANLRDAAYYGTGLMDGVIWYRTTLPDGQVVVKRRVGYD
jgi:uncharacterized protein YjbI with pentapeptide repeats